MITKLRDNAAVISVAISLLSFTVSTKSCNESHEARLIAEAANRAFIIPKTIVLEKMNAGDGLTHYHVVMTLRNFGKAPATDITWVLKYGIEAGSERVFPHVRSENVMEADKEFASSSEVGLTPSELIDLKGRRRLFRILVTLNYKDSLTDKKVVSDYCFTHVGGGFDNPVSPGLSDSVMLFACDSDYVANYKR